MRYIHIYVQNGRKRLKTTFTYWRGTANKHDELPLKITNEPTPYNIIAF